MKQGHRKILEVSGIWFICALAVIWFVPFGRIIESVKAESRKDPSQDELALYKAKASEKHSRAGELVRSGRIYSAAEYAEDMTDLRLMLNRVVLPACAEECFEKYISGLLNISKHSYLERAKKEAAVKNPSLNSDRLKIMADWSWNQDFNTELQKCQGKFSLTPEQRRARNDEFVKLLTWIGWFYLVFVPFAAIIVFLRLYCGGRSIREEFILRPGRLVLAIFFWPYGVSGFCKGLAAREWRYQRLRVSCLAVKGRGYYSLTDEEDEMLRRRATERIVNFDALVSEITGESLMAIAKRSKWAVLVTILGPFVTVTLSFATGAEKKTTVVVVDKKPTASLEKAQPEEKLSSGDIPATSVDDLPTIYLDCVEARLPAIEAVLLFLHLVWWYDTRPPPAPVNVPDPIPK